MHWCSCCCGPPYDVEYRVVRPDGSMRVVRSQGEVIRDEPGRPVREFGILQDITALRQAEHELRPSEARFRTFVDHATDAFFLLDEQVIVVDVNRKACAGLGYSREQRERDIMALVVVRRLNKQIASELGLAEVTVKAHRSQLMHKMGAKSLPALVRMADRLGGASEKD